MRKSGPLPTKTVYKKMNESMVQIILQKVAYRKDISRATFKKKQAFL